MNDTDVEWICVTCFQTLASKLIPRETAFELLRKHEIANHPGREPSLFVNFARTPELSVTRHVGLTPSTRPKPAITPQEKPGHTPRTLPNGNRALPQKVPARQSVLPSRSVPAPKIHAPVLPPNTLPEPGTRFPFKMLPPGKWRLSDIIDYYKCASKNPRWEYAGKTVEWERLEQIQKLRPEQTHLGRDGWYGYIVFTFDWTTRVILECPVKPNAIYVINGPWMELVRHSKRELLTKYEVYCTRVTHSGDWFSKLDDAIGYVGRPKHLRHLRG